jgi:hypothetical protein
LHPGWKWHGVLPPAERGLARLRAVEAGVVRKGLPSRRTTAPGPNIRLSRGDHGSLPKSARLDSCG